MQKDCGQDCFFAAASSERCRTRETGRRSITAPEVRKKMFVTYRETRDSVFPLRWVSTPLAWLAHHPVRYHTPTLKDRNVTSVFTISRRGMQVQGPPYHLHSSPFVGWATAKKPCLMFQGSGLLPMRLGRSWIFSNGELRLLILDCTALVAVGHVG